MSDARKQWNKPLREMLGFFWTENESIGRKRGEGDERDERDDSGKFREKRRACYVRFSVTLWDCFLSSAVSKCRRDGHLLRGLLPYVLPE